MTTTVKVTAHNHETAVVLRTPAGDVISEARLKDGEEESFIVTASQSVQVFEVTQPDTA